MHSVRQKVLIRGASRLSRKGQFSALPWKALVMHGLNTATPRKKKHMNVNHAAHAVLVLTVCPGVARVSDEQGGRAL